MFFFISSKPKYSFQVRPLTNSSLKMEAFESDNHQQQQQNEELSEPIHVPQQQSLLEEAGNLSPTQEQSDLLLEAASSFSQHEAQIPDLLDIAGENMSNEKEPEIPQQYEPHEDLLLYTTEKEDLPSSHEIQNEFDFHKELPSVPGESPKDEDLPMTFSSSHFQAEDQPLVDDSPTEELMKQHMHEDFEIPNNFVIDDQLMKENFEEDFQSHSVKDVTNEPVLQSSHQEVEEEKDVPTISTQKQEEIIVSTPPTSSHRPAPPIPVEEEEVVAVPEPQTSPKSQTSPVLIDSTHISPTLSKKERSSEPVIPTEPASATKTRSVRSTKTEAAVGRTLLCKFHHSLILIHN